MRYFVVAEDGSKYGPADVKLLNAWIAEGRLLPVMTLEEEGSHHKVTAASLDGLDFYSLEPGSASPSAQGEALVLAFDPPIQHESEKLDVFLAWSMMLVTLCLSGVRSIAGVLGVFTALLGITAALKAKDKGIDSASVVLAFNLVALVIWALARLFFLLR
jgi:hypothetical protein